MGDKIWQVTKKSVPPTLFAKARLLCYNPAAVAPMALGRHIGRLDRRISMVRVTLPSSALVSMPLLLALGCGVAVCLALVVHRRDLTSVLALAGFSGLFVTYIITSFSPFIVVWLEQARPGRNLLVLVSALTLAVSTVGALAVGCLIAALWLGLHRRSRP
jgi:transposase InsO family protein